ncbi:MAG: hypothetical protein DRP70_00510 [Spirochaetes bacterium]|nr:MAG: hypothetical protein DRP70_00510 [Spirochaetota bacterium]RKX98501.1 MAG: hypothetical protein DRZ90_02600 [Spirochaetota bacterium]
MNDREGVYLLISGIREGSVYQPLSMGVRPMGKPVPQVKKHNGLSSISFTPLKILPLPAAALMFLLLFGAGFFDRLVLISKPVSFDSSPGDVEPLVRVNKSAIEFPSFENSSLELVFTRHRVLRGETLSRISYKYGLSPSTLISVNSLENPEDVKSGKILIIPYIDGIRVTPLPGESPAEAAVRFGTGIGMVQLIPGSGDYFISGEYSTGSTPASFSKDVFLYPVSGRILTAYGETVDTLTGIGYESEGLDLSAGEGTPVHASKDGTVILTGNHSSYGLYVIMSHSGGWKSFYGHLSRINVAFGDKLESGMSLGLAGRSGTARSPRLYFALIHNGESVDPLDYLY